MLRGRLVLLGGAAALRGASSLTRVAEVCLDAVARTETAALATLPRDSVRRIAVAALCCFAADGFHGTTTRDIARGARVSAGSPYNHFSSKEEILRFWVAEAGRSAEATMRDAVAGADGPRDRLRALVAAMTAWHARHHVLSGVAFTEFTSLTAEHRGELAPVREGMDRLVLDLVSAGDFAVADPRTAALAIFAMVVDVARWFDEDGGDTPEALGERYADLVDAMVTGRPPPLSRR